VNTYTAITSVFLTLVLTFFSARVAEADVWVCSQANGTVLYTNEPQEAGCKKFEPGSQLIYLPPPSVSENPPQPESDYDTQEADEPDVQIPTPAEEQTVVPPYTGESNDGQQDSFWTWDDNRQYIAVYTYTYVPGFFRSPSSRHKRLHGFEHKPRAKNEIQSRVPRFRQSAPRTVTPDLRKNSVQARVPTTLPQSVSPMPAEPRPFAGSLARGGAPTLPQSVSPNAPKHLHNSADRTRAPGALPQSPPSQPMKRRP
jgi:hypothetical protein